MSRNALIKDAKGFDGFTVDVNRLSIYPEWHPRFDVRSKYEPAPEHVASIIAMGVPDPLLVQVVREDGQEVEGRDGKTRTLPAGIYVIDGHQRRNAAVAAQRELRRRGEKAAEIMVPVLPYRGPGAKDEDFLASLSIAMNQRVIDEPLVTAEKLAALVRRFGGDIDRAATMSGFPATFVKQHLALLEAAPEVREAVERKELAVTAAARIAKQPAARQRETLARAKEATKDRPADGRRKTAVSVRDMDRASSTRPVRPTDAEMRAEMRRTKESNPERCAALRWALTGEGS